MSLFNKKYSIDITDITSAFPFDLYTRISGYIDSDVLNILSGSYATSGDLINVINSLSGYASFETI